ncbi:MAG TPA: molybdate ABC transporter permease subunit [Myxococcota bacterium]|nr:molybdate ABC transporter permease subunit [Myxococcota bacterium]
MSPELGALLLSLEVAALGSLGAALPGVPLAWFLARQEFRGKALVEALVVLPLVLPPIVTGYALLTLFGRDGLLELPIAFTTTGAGVAAGVMGFPLLVRTLRVAFEAVDPRLELAARSLGASPLSAFARVTLPLAAPGLVAGALLCFARALGEFGATITFAGNIEGETRTLTLAIWSAIQSPGGEDAALRLVALSVVCSVGAVIIGETLVRRARQRTMA